MRIPYPFLALVVLGACSGARTPAENVAAAGNAAAADPAGEPPHDADVETVPPSETALPTDAWVGKWVGVEGLALDIEPSSMAGKYAVKVTLMDGAGTYAGTAQGETIGFVRDGKAETIRPVTGDKTGLKYLASKQDCLMIKPGEGFCRD